MNFKRKNKLKLNLTRNCNAFHRIKLDKIKHKMLKGKKSLRRNDDKKTRNYILLKLWLPVFFAQFFGFY